MKSLLLLSQVVLWFPTSLISQVSENGIKEAENSLFETRKAFGSEISLQIDSENIEKLALELRVLNRQINESSDHITSEQKTEAHQLRDEGIRRLKTYPEHANYFVNRIHERLEIVDRKERSWDDLYSKIARDFQKLQSFPTFESVMALMPFLDEEKGWFLRSHNPELPLYYGQKTYRGIYSLRGMALTSLNRIGIRENPVVERIKRNNGEGAFDIHFHFGGIPTLQQQQIYEDWKQWWEEVKAGERVFSFKHDPNTFYNHLGVVEEPVANGERVQKGPQPTESISPEPAVEKARSLSWLYWCLGVVIFGGLAKLVLNGRKS